MTENRPLIIFGTGDIAELAHYYFTNDSNYKVVAFTVDRDYVSGSRFCNLPVIPFETLEESYPPKDHRFFVSIVYTELNRLRTRLYGQAKEKGFSAASYISPRAFVWRNCRIEEHCFIFENNVIQPFVHVGKNVILWSGNHIGHHSTIGDHCFISSHVVISGHVKVGESCFMGVNSTVSDRITIGNNCLIGAGALILRDVEDAQKVVGIRKKKV